MSLEIQHLSVRYGSTPVLHDLSIKLASSAQVVAVVGATGAGKSSLLRALGGCAPCAVKFAWTVTS